MATHGRARYESLADPHASVPLILDHTSVKYGSSPLEETARPRRVSDLHVINEGVVNPMMEDGSTVIVNRDGIPVTNDGEMMDSTNRKTALDESGTVISPMTFSSLRSTSVPGVCVRVCVCVCVSPSLLGFQEHVPYLRDSRRTKYEVSHTHNTLCHPILSRKQLCMYRKERTTTSLPAIPMANTPKRPSTSLITQHFTLLTLSPLVY